ncbi:hypothetical protein [Salinibacterium sp.]|uniref:glycosyltransferase n=1 Tax=Salinibacterium sp. TaxID=1915057 RepID=UPI00286C87CE|nr:hypothetical protein [Salinibacterium sp.]
MIDNTVIAKAWNLLPAFVSDPVAATIDRVQGVQVPLTPRVDQSHPVRVFIGPVNYAGQAYRWGRAMEQNPGVVSRNMVGAENNLFGYPADLAVRWRTMTHSRSWRREFLNTLVTGYTHIMVEAEMPLLGGAYGQDVRKQVQALRDRGLTVGMIAHGTDIRLPSRHRELESWSHYRDDEWAPVVHIERVVQRNLDMLADIGAPTFVSTAGLLIDVPYAHLLPVVIDPEFWANDEVTLARERPRVLHIPSNPITKGTLLIDPAMRGLDDEGLIEYIQPSGLTQGQMPALYAVADIVLDQFRAADYGVGACESMAAGRLVVSHVSEQVRDVVRTESGVDLPIVEATVDTLDEVLRDVLTRRGHYREVAARGPEFVRRLHDGRHARASLERHFLFTDR